jgi:mRNA interferase MazF
LIFASPFQWSVFTIDIDGAPGAGRNGSWPVLVVSRESANQALPVVTVLPLATRRTDRRVYPNEVLLRSGTAGLKSDAIAMAHQTRTVAKRRLTDQLGTIENDDLRSEIRRAMCVQLNLDAT